MPKVEHFQFDDNTPGESSKGSDIEKMYEFSNTKNPRRRVMNRSCRQKAKAFAAAYVQRNVMYAGFAVVAIAANAWFNSGATLIHGIEAAGVFYVAESTDTRAGTDARTGAHAQEAAEEAELCFAAWLVER